MFLRIFFCVFCFSLGLQSELGWTESSALNQQSADIKWPTVEGVDGYHLQVATDKNFENILVDTETTQARFTWSKAQAGYYFVRIASMKGGQRSAYSSTKLILRSYGPRLHFPSHKKKISFDPSKPRKIVLSWESIPDANSYQLQVSRKADFRTTVVDKLVKGSKVRVTKLSQGSYLWRIRAKQKGKPFGAWSKRRYFEWFPKAVEPKVTQREEESEEFEAEEVDDEEPVYPPFVKELEEIPEPLVYSFGLGVGVNAQSFKQTQPSTNTDFLSVNPGSYSLDFSVRRPHYWMLSGWYTSQPGEVITTTTEASEDTYNWNAYGLDFDWLVQESARWESAIRVGVQNNQLPFIDLQENNFLQMESNTLMLVSLGTHIKYKYSSAWDWSASFYYMHGLSSSGGDREFEATDGFGVGGGLSALYHWKDHWKLVGSWHGQYLSHSYTSDSELSGSGEQEMFFSSLEARVIYTF